jgi:hypothetical protein
MPGFTPSFDRPCPLSATMDAAPGDALWTRWQAECDAAAAARQGPPSPVAIHNATQLATLERFLFGRVVTPELRDF